MYPRSLGEDAPAQTPEKSTAMWAWVFLGGLILVTCMMNAQRDKRAR